MEVNDLKLEIKQIKENCGTQDRKLINLQFQLTSITQIMKGNDLFLKTH